MANLEVGTQEAILPELQNELAEQHESLAELHAATKFQAFGRTATLGEFDNLCPVPPEQRSFAANERFAAKMLHKGGVVIPEQFVHLLPEKQQAEQEQMRLSETIQELLQFETKPAEPEQAENTRKQTEQIERASEIKVLAPVVATIEDPAIVERLHYEAQQTEAVNVQTIRVVPAAAAPIKRKAKPASLAKAAGRDVAAAEVEVPEQLARATKDVAIVHLEPTIQINKDTPKPKPMPELLTKDDAMPVLVVERTEQDRPVVDMSVIRFADEVLTPPVVQPVIHQSVEIIAPSVVLTDKTEMFIEVASKPDEGVAVPDLEQLEYHVDLRADVPLEATVTIQDNEVDTLNTYLDESQTELDDSIVYEAQNEIGISPEYRELPTIIEEALPAVYKELAIDPPVLTVAETIEREPEVAALKQEIEALLIEIKDIQVINLETDRTAEIEVILQEKFEELFCLKGLDRSMAKKAALQAVKYILQQNIQQLDQDTSQADQLTMYYLRGEQQHSKLAKAHGTLARKFSDVLHLQAVKLGQFIIRSFALST